MFKLRRRNGGGGMTSAGHLILVVEDEPQIRHFLRTTLTAEGYRVIEAENGERGVLEAATHKPDLVMVDLGLPDIDGVEVENGERGVLEAATHKPDLVMVDLEHAA